MSVIFSQPKARHCCHRRAMQPRLRAIEPLYYLVFKNTVHCCTHTYDYGLFFIAVHSSVRIFIIRMSGNI